MTELATVLRDGLRQASPAERKVARVLLAKYPASALQSATTIATQAGVSAPTVIRLVTRLGFDGYPDFQRRVRDELAAGSPAALYTQADIPSEAQLLGHRSADCQVDAIRRTFTELPASELDTAIDWFADGKRRLLVHGGRFSALFAQYLTLHLAQLRDGVAAVPTDPVQRAALLAGLGRRDVLVVFDYRRYEATSGRIAGLAREQDARIVLFTDPWLSPISAVADVVLPTRVDSLSPYDSLVPLVGLVEAVVTGVLARLGDAGRARLQRIEDLTQRWNLYQDE